MPSLRAQRLAEPVEPEQRVIAGAAEMAVVGAGFLLAIGRALARSLIERDMFDGRRRCTLSIPPARKSAGAARLSGRLSRFVSNALGRSRGRVYAAR